MSCELVYFYSIYIQSRPFKRSRNGSPNINKQVQVISVFVFGGTTWTFYRLHQIELCGSSFTNDCENTLTNIDIIDPRKLIIICVTINVKTSMHYQDQIKCLMNPCRYCFEGIASLVESLDYMDLCEQLADPILSTRHLGKPTSAQYELQILPGLLDIRFPGSIHERVCKVANVNFICHFLWLASQREWTQICRANPKTYCRWVI